MIGHGQICALLGLAVLLMGARSAGRTGKLLVESLTIGADVFVDGERVATIPMERPVRLKPGKHTIRLSLLGYGDYIDAIRIRSRRTRTISIDLVATAGILRVDGSPAGAEIIVDGRAVGQIPFRDAVEFGDHDMEVHSTNHLPFRQRITLEAGEETRIDVRLATRPIPPPPRANHWYSNKWIWVGVAGVVIVSSILTGLAVTSDDARPEPLVVVPVETIQ